MPGASRHLCSVVPASMRTQSQDSAQEAVLPCRGGGQLRRSPESGLSLGNSALKSLVSAHCGRGKKGEKRRIFHGRHACEKLSSASWFLSTRGIGPSLCPASSFGARHSERAVLGRTEGEEPLQGPGLSYRHCPASIEAGGEGRLGTEAAAAQGELCC